MTTNQLVMPKLGLTMAEGVLLEWKVAPGDRFVKGDVLFVVETDKAATDIEAEADGELAERLVEEGDTVPVGAPVGLLAGGGATNTLSALASSKQSVGEAAASTRAAPSSAAQTDRGSNDARIIATPLARRIASNGQIDLASIAGSGPRGRIKAIDVERAISPSQATRQPVPAAQLHPSDLSAVRSRPTAMQATMARRLSAVKQGVPHFYLSTEAEVSALLDLRAELNADPDFAKLTLTHFLLAAVGRALRAQPNINRVWDQDDIVTYSTTSVSMAVEAENGLYVPVVPDCGTSSIDQIGTAARAMVEKARNGKLSAADMNGAAIAVSNAGMYDVTWLTSIINPGQSAILGVGSVRDVFRPDSSGAPVLRRELGLVFSGDHRVHTGVEGLAFLNHVKATLENPRRLLRQI